MAPIVLVQVEHRRGAQAGRLLKRLAAGFLGQLGKRDAEVSVVVTTDARIRELNAHWRGKDRATDVLSFPAGETPRLEGQPESLGDVVVSLDTAEARAREDGRPLEDELARYLAHGLLHLLGHDHHRPSEAKAMAAEEERLLGGLGMLGESPELGVRRPAPAGRGGEKAEAKRGPGRAQVTASGTSTGRRAPEGQEGRGAGKKAKKRPPAAAAEGTKKGAREGRSKPGSGTKRR